MNDYVYIVKVYYMIWLIEVLEFEYNFFIVFLLVVWLMLDYFLVVIDVMILFVIVKMGEKNGLSV